MLGGRADGVAGGLHAGAARTSVPGRRAGGARLPWAAPLRAPLRARARRRAPRGLAPWRCRLAERRHLGIQTSHRVVDSPKARRLAEHVSNLPKALKSVPNSPLSVQNCSFPPFAQSTHAIRKSPASGRDVDAAVVERADELLLRAPPGAARVVVAEPRARAEGLRIVRHQNLDQRAMIATLPVQCAR